MYYYVYVYVYVYVYIYMYLAQPRAPTYRYSKKETIRHTHTHRQAHTHTLRHTRTVYRPPIASLRVSIDGTPLVTCPPPAWLS